MIEYDDSDESFEDDLSKSKTQVKREMTELQRLGARLITLNQTQLQKLNLPQRLYDSICEAKKISSHGAKRRQLQYIGKLMRDIEDPEFIREYFQKLEMKHQKSNAYYHMLEAWRERLITEDSSTLTQFIEQFPMVDRQHLRTLLTNAKKEREMGKPVGAARSLFRYLRDTLEGQQKGSDE